MVGTPPFRTLCEALLAAPSEKRFVTMWNDEDDHESITFGEYRRRALRQAGYLRSLGVTSGDTVIVIMPQGIPLMTAFAAAMLLGAVPAILAYPNFKVDPAKYRFGLSGVSTNLKARLILLDKDFPDELMQHVSVMGSTQVARFNWEDSAETDPISPYEVRPDQLAFIQHSAGTTGLQKGVALSHNAVLTHLGRLTGRLGVGGDDRIYSWLPLYHDMGLIACFMLPLVSHTPLVMQSPVDWVMQPAAMPRLISTYRCTLAWVPNFALQFLARRVRPEDRESLDLSCLRALINCAEPIRASSVDEFLGTYSGAGLRPSTVQSSYAMAETVFAVTQSDVGADAPRRIWIDGTAFRKDRQAVQVSRTAPGAICLVSCGRVLPGTQVRIVSDHGKELDPGYVGEIVIQTDSMFGGYFNRPDLTAKALRDGWYWSGDLGFLLDEELYVIGRKKDLIIVGGENIYPQDVEETVSGHPAIYDGRVVAFGHYDSNLGTEIICVVAEVRAEESLHHAQTIVRELKAAISSELGVAAGRIYLKPPRWIVKSTAGKPARSTTREKLLMEHAELQIQGDMP